MTIKAEGAPVNPSGYAQIVEEHTGSTPGTLTRRYTYGLDLISQSRWTGSTWDTHFYLTDGLGSTRALLSSFGSISDTYVYDAYGTLIASTGTTPNNYLFCGEQGWNHRAVLFARPHAAHRICTVLGERCACRRCFRSAIAASFTDHLMMISICQTGTLTPGFQQVE